MNASSPLADSRRQFLRQSSAALAGGAWLAAGLQTTGFNTEARAEARRAAEKDGVLNIGLVGCGGRGTGAAAEALRADPRVRLVALGDAFDDRLQLCLATLQRKTDLGERIDVPKERQFAGFDAYQKVIASDVDVVLLCTPPHFRPIHLKAAIDADKHVFAEKPVGVDAPGVRSALATCGEAEKKGLGVLSGLCLRYSKGFQETIRRIHAGAVGDIHTLQANDYRGGIWLRTREPDWTDMHWHMRNWYYFTWLSGDFNVEQHVHFLDVCAWAMGGYPVKAIGMGGRHVRTGPEYGNIFDHHSVVYEFANGAKLFSNTRQMPKCKSDLSASVVGSQGRALLTERRKGLTITSGKDAWVYEGVDNDIYQTEHDEFFASIRAGRPLNNGQYMCDSTMLAILGRMATYTGQEITWEQAYASQERLGPAKYEWGPAPEAPIAIPGVTKFA